MDKIVLITKPLTLPKHDAVGITKYRVHGRVMINDKLKKTGCGYGLMKILPQYLPERIKENHKQPVCIIASVLAEIKTKNLLNTNLECSCYTTLLAFVLYVNSKKMSKSDL
jgi:hypothetical protein